MKTTKVVVFTFVLLSFIVTTSYLLADLNTTYNVSGIVMYGKGTEAPAPGVRVEIYESGTLNLISSGYTNVAGYFIISGISGSVDVISFPADVIEDYVPTWYPNAISQTEATPINVNTNISGITIELQPE